jgi:undecaprenyl-diphosphatase
MDSLIQFDQNLFVFLNGLHAPFWDPIMVFFSGKISWIPLYLVLLWFLIRDRKKRFFISILMIALMVLLTDQTSVFIKEHVQRLRPCHNNQISALIHLVKGCGGDFGFVSSHAANTFGAAMFFTLFFRNRWIGFCLLFWATMVSYSRIYLGVHYPGDVLGGALLGIAIGSGIFYLDKFLLFKLFHFRSANT